MQRAKQHIDSFPGSPLPTLVRAPKLVRNSTVNAVYASQGLTHAGVDVLSADDVVGANFVSISAALVVNLLVALGQGDTDITVLFHDIHSHTADNLGTPGVGYLALIEQTVAGVGGYVVFEKCMTSAPMGQN